MPVGVKQVGAGEKSSENSVESEGCSPELFNRERLKRTRQLSKRTFGITNLTFSWRRRIPISRCSQFLVPIFPHTILLATAHSCGKWCPLFTILCVHRQCRRSFDDELPPECPGTDWCVRVGEYNRKFKLIKLIGKLSPFVKGSKMRRWSSGTISFSIALFRPCDHVRQSPLIRFSMSFLQCWC